MPAHYSFSEEDHFIAESDGRVVLLKPSGTTTLYKLYKGQAVVWVDGQGGFTPRTRTTKYLTKDTEYTAPRDSRIIMYAHVGAGEGAARGPNEMRASWNRKVIKIPQGTTLRWFPKETKPAAAAAAATDATLDGWLRVGVQPMTPPFEEDEV